MYLQILEVVLGTIFYFISRQSDFNLAAGEIKGSVGTVTLMWLLMTLTMILIWMGITSVHFLINWIGGFLPLARQKFVNFILYIVVTVVGVMIFNYTSGNVFRVIYSGSQGITTLSQINNVIWLGIGIVVVWGVIFTALNIYLLKRWTETVR